MTVLESIQKSADFLQKKGVESPRLHAELLLAHVLNLPRMKLYLNFERALAEAETNTLRELVLRRAQREPLQHIVGSASFCGLEIAVNRHVLVPRPETELLAEEGWKFLQHLATPQPLALDFGTGSGCIAIALAVNCPTAKITAVDVSADALATARRNAESHRVTDRIRFVQADGLNPLLRTDATPGLFDLIVSNPPYIPTAEIEQLDPEVREFDPRGALDGGPDGLQFHRKLALESRPLLRPGGTIMVEFGDGQGPAISTLFESEKWIVEAIREDYTGRQRILIARI